MRVLPSIFDAKLIGFDLTFQELDVALQSFDSVLQFGHIGKPTFGLFIPASKCFVFILELLDFHFDFHVSLQKKKAPATEESSIVGTF